jgi:hypothetical protein
MISVHQGSAILDRHGLASSIQNQGNIRMTIPLRIHNIGCRRCFTDEEYDAAVGEGLTVLSLVNLITIIAKPGLEIQQVFGKSQNGCRIAGR